VLSTTILAPIIKDQVKTNANNPNVSKAPIGIPLDFVCS
jgi:hypothetical protein